MAAASTRSPRRSLRAGCETFFVAQLSEARRVRAVAPKAVIYVLNGFSAGAGQAFVETRRAAGDQQPGRTRRMGPFRLDQRLRRRRGAARRHRHEPARPLHRRGGGDRVPHPLGKPRHHAVDEPPRLRRPARASAERSADPAVPRNPLAVPRHRQLAGQFLRHLPRRRRPIATWCAPASRSTAATRRRASPIRCGR